MSESILAIVEHSDGALKKVAGEICSEAVRLGKANGADVCAVAIGPGAAKAAEQLGDFGITSALAVEGDSLATYSGETHALALAEAVRSRSPALVILGATSWSGDLLGRLGAHLGVAPASDCVGLDWNGGQVLARRPVYAGKAILTVEAAGRPVLASLRPNVFAIEAGQGATVTVENMAAPGAPERHGTLVSRTESAGEKVDLTEAATVVAGGRGLKDAETFAALLEPLAESLGAAVGASRAVVDAGWRPHSEQVGQTGKTVAPKLYIACGVSGAIQHLAGMRTSQTIVAINKDADAPIFKVADYGIVGDVTEVLPALTEQVRAALQG